MHPSASSLSFRVFIMKPVKLSSALFQRENASSTLEGAQFGECRKLSLTLVWRSVCFHTWHMMFPGSKSIHLSDSYCLYRVQRWWLNTLLLSFILTTFLLPLKMLFIFPLSRWRSQHFKRVYIKLIHLIVQNKHNTIKQLYFSKKKRYETLWVYDSIHPTELLGWTLSDRAGGRGSRSICYYYANHWFGQSSWEVQASRVAQW